MLNLFFKIEAQIQQLEMQVYLTSQLKIINKIVYYLVKIKVVDARIRELICHTKCLSMEIIPRKQELL